jgi:hypothetical protein
MPFAAAVVMPVRLKPNCFAGMVMPIIKQVKKVRPRHTNR